MTTAQEVAACGLRGAFRPSSSGEQIPANPSRGRAKKSGAPRFLRGDFILYFCINFSPSRVRLGQLEVEGAAAAAVVGDHVAAGFTGVKGHKPSWVSCDQAKR